MNFHKIVVGLWFDRKDIERLRELSTSVHDEADRHAFKTAAETTESGGFVVYQTMTTDNLAQFIALFTSEGIDAPTVLPLESSARGLKLRV
jgi:hypothetical protein